MAGPVWGAAGSTQLNQLKLSTIGRQDTDPVALTFSCTPPLPSTAGTVCPLPPGTVRVALCPTQEEGMFVMCLSVELWPKD